MNRTQSQIIYPQDAMPKKLLGTNNFQFKLNQVYSQLVILNQSSILEGSKIPNIPLNQITLENSKSQGNLYTYQNNYNTSINQSMPLNQNLNMSQFNLKDSLLNPSSTKSNQSLFQSYEYSVKHFGLLCDRTFIENSKAFKSQKYGAKRNPRGIKLEPLEQQQIHNIDLNKHSKILSKQKSFLPYSQISDWDMRMYIKKSIDYKGRLITISLNSIEIVAQEQLKSSEEEMQSEQEEQINQNSQNKKGSKKILNHMLNFSILEYLIQYKQEQIQEFFEKYMKIVSYKQEDDQDNLIDIPRLEFDFEQFETNTQIDSKNTEFQNEIYPESTEITSSEIENVVYQVNYPYIEILDQQLNYKKQIYLSREQLRELLFNKFSNLENYMQQYQEDIKELYPEEQEKNEQEQQEQTEEQEQKEENQPASKPPSQQQIENQVYFLGSQQPKSVENKRQSTKQSHQNSQNQLEQSRNNQTSDLVTNLARLSLTQLEEKKQISFTIKDSDEEKSVFELLGKKYYKELVNQEEYIIISFFPSKVTLKQQNVEFAQQITHNLTFLDFYELIALTTHYDLLNYIISKIRFSGERKSSSQPNTDDEGDSLKKRPSFLKKVDLQLPKYEFDPKNFIILNQENEVNGLLKENLGIVTLDNKKYSIKISPPIFEINYSLENRREVQIATIQQLNEIIKRGFNFRFQVTP
ncbi:hypothetical protein TTHERM_00448750 (macronuclear) [Tetrahymena thermophila SB210]|uniref:Uncharacterized protein n=1 Tax=Tetrahymena thermophila (strain SB210) TaxID=312017 RepID=Q239E0_TETTS|nr:hypothetical protein TTHERM_00448750 [Tetrahymena thermophila SB210]EAR93030.2 hypothetical protein TTHERM_00448750 [Tetrahymena thermophila SB210]|eukprot:XP_001013275.2 hypothetical protein TTHERM_00448750 [Tetrahymena thermophila SB210]